MPGDHDAMTHQPLAYVWRTGWHVLGRMLARNLAQTEIKHYSQTWLGWRLPVFWITALLFCLPLCLFSKFLADRDHVFVAVIAHLINIVAILPIGAYFSLKWWIEKRPPGGQAAATRRRPPLSHNG